MAGPMLWIGAIADLAPRLAALLCPQREPWVFLECQDFAPERRRTYLAGRALLKHALISVGLISADQPLPQLESSEHGKPSLPASFSPWDFNLSHSADFMALILGSGPQGIDIEQVTLDLKRPSYALCARVLSSDEFAYWTKLWAPVATELMALGIDIRGHKVPTSALGALSPAAVTALTSACHYFKQQWTLREAMVKLIGTSIFALDYMVFAPERGLCGFVKSAIPQAANAKTQHLLAMLSAQQLPQGYFVSATLGALALSCFCPERPPTLGAKVLGPAGFTDRELALTQCLKLSLM